MKIRKIRYKNHPLFGNTEFDFTDSEGNVVDNIIIAGENGVGKSRLMEDIYKFSKLEFPREKENTLIYFEIEISDEHATQLTYEAKRRNFVIDYGKVFFITIDSNIINSWESIKVENITLANKRFNIPSYNLNEKKYLFQTLYSNAEVNFTSQPIRTVGTSDIDSQNSSERSDSDLATNISQLLVDIQTLDAHDLNNWVRNNKESIAPDDILDIRMKRFTSAFDYMFPSKKYERIENTFGSKEVIFSEGDNEMTLNQLSSGEKQIVFRGSFLLRNKESSKGALILIDEPELSLHPKWQIKSSDFFKKLFSDTEGNQTSQIIISTHSPFIIHNPNRNNDKVIILKKDELGKTYISENPEFVSWTNEQAIKEAFSIDFEDFSNNITVFLEGETDEKYFNTAKHIFRKSQLPLKFKWIGRLNENNNVENTGDKALNNAISFFKANEDSIKGKIVFLYDNDTKKPSENYDNIYVRKMSQGVHTVFKKGVESLLNTDSIIDINRFYNDTKKMDDYGAESTIRTLDKTKLCNFICEELDAESQKNILSNISDEIEILEELFN